MAFVTPKKDKWLKPFMKNLYTIAKPTIFIVFFLLLIWQEDLYFHRLDDIRGIELQYRNFMGHPLEWNPDFVFLYSIPAFIVILLCLCVIFWFSAKWIDVILENNEKMKAHRKCAKHWMNLILFIGMGSISTFMVLNMDWFLESMDVKASWRNNEFDNNLCEWKQDTVYREIHDIVIGKTTENEDAAASEDAIRKVSMWLIASYCLFLWAILDNYINSSLDKNIDPLNLHMLIEDFGLGIDGLDIFSQFATVIDLAPVFGVYRMEETILFTLLITSLMFTVAATLIRSPETDDSLCLNHTFCLSRSPTARGDTGANQNNLNNRLTEKSCCPVCFVKPFLWFNKPEVKPIILFAFKFFISLLNLTSRGFLIYISFLAQITRYPLGDIVFIICELMVTYVEIINFFYERRQQTSTTVYKHVCEDYNSVNGCKNDPCPCIHVCRNCQGDDHGHEECYRGTKQDYLIAMIYVKTSTNKSCRKATQPCCCPLLSNTVHPGNVESV